MDFQNFHEFLVRKRQLNESPAYHGRRHAGLDSMDDDFDDEEGNELSGLSVGTLDDLESDLEDEPQAGAYSPEGGMSMGASKIRGQHGLSSRINQRKAHRIRTQIAMLQQQLRELEGGTSPRI